MRSKKLLRMRALVRSEEYVVTVHAAQKLRSLGLVATELEALILSGSIAARQRDEVDNDWKYVVEGAMSWGRLAATVVKLSPTGKLVFITVYRL